ncbi:MAG: hypothetical protein M0R03_14330 [Novosphingobium sp.]|nr:hypothetical protein [Novosphingobium sp.]
MADMNLPATFALFDRGTIASAVEVLVAVLDAMDGDTDIELNGDELDGSMGEDDFCAHNQGIWPGPGCPMSDPGEEDDPSGQHDEDGINTVFPVRDGPGCPLNDEDRDDPADRAGHKRRIWRTRCFGRYRQYLDLRTSSIGSKLARYELIHLPIVPSRRSLLRRKRGVPRRPRA